MKITPFPTVASLLRMYITCCKNYRGVSECELRAGGRDSTNVNDWSRCLMGTQWKVSQPELMPSICHLGMKSADDEIPVAPTP